MKKTFSILIILIFCQNCSFDQKSGIWKNENIITNNKENDIFREFKTLSSSNDYFKEIIEISDNFKFRDFVVSKNSDWSDIFYRNTNNFENFEYNELNQTFLKGKKISKYKINDKILFKNDKAIITDLKGNIIIYSITENRIVNKFNFYRKKLRKINISLNIILENSVVYVSDNIGFLYAYNIDNNKVIWAKNYKVPFRSNLKITKNNLIAANQNNNLYFFNKFDGEIITLIPTEDTPVKNEFINNLALNSRNLFFLNTYGSLYSIDKSKMKIKWFSNLNQSLDINPSNLFFGNQIISYKDKLVISSNKQLYIINENNGSIIFKKNFFSSIKPLVVNDYIFLITNNDLIIAMDLIDGKIIYSYDLNRKISEFLNTKKKMAKFRSLIMANSKIYVFLNNSYYLKMDLNGDIEAIKKIPSKLNSDPILINGSLFFLDQKNRLNIFN